MALRSSAEASTRYVQPCPAAESACRPGGSTGLALGQLAGPTGPGRPALGRRTPADHFLILTYWAQHGLLWCPAWCGCSHQTCCCSVIPPPTLNAASPIPLASPLRLEGPPSAFACSRHSLRMNAALQTATLVPQNCCAPPG
jgi:hypothetical protein